MRREHENLRCEHGKPHTGWSSYERRTCVACTKIYFTNTESPTLGGHHTSVLCTKILDKKTESPHLGVYMGATVAIRYEHGEPEHVVKYGDV